MNETIDTGDTVKHGPTGETWLVAYVQGDHLAWCGWPEGEAQLSDCTLVKKASPEEREKLLRQMADSSSSGPRQRYARRILGLTASLALLLLTMGCAIRKPVHALYCEQLTRDGKHCLVWAPHKDLGCVHDVFGDCK